MKLLTGHSKRDVYVLLLGLVSFGLAAWHLCSSASIETLGHGSALFADFVDIWRPSAELALSKPPSPPVDGYYSGPGFLLVLAAFEAANGGAELLWGIAIGTASLAVAVMPWALRRDARLGFGPEHVALALLAVALWHNFKWGQVSAFVAVLLVLHVSLLERCRTHWAALCLAIAIGIKLHCAAFLIVHMARRRWRVLGWSIGLALLTSVGLPALVFGQGFAFEVWRVTFARIAEVSTRLVNDADSQFLPHVALRYIDTLTRSLGGTDPAGLSAELRQLLVTIGKAASLLLLGCIIYRIGRRRQRRLETVQPEQHATSSTTARDRTRGPSPLHEDDRALAPRQEHWFDLALYVSLMPLWLPTAWPHDFVLLAFAQAMALEGLRSARRRSALLVALCLASIVASSWPVAAAFGWGRRPATIGLYAAAALATATVLLTSARQSRPVPRLANTRTLTKP